ncbi:hypothetical protein [Microlunatus endophyticus]
MRGSGVRLAVGPDFCARLGDEVDAGWAVRRGVDPVVGAADAAGEAVV